MIFVGPKNSTTGKMMGKKKNKSASTPEIVTGVASWIYHLCMPVLALLTGCALLYGDEIVLEPT